MKKIIISIFVIFFLTPCVFAKNSINIIFCIDENYILQNLLTVNSILKNNKSNSNYHFYIIGEELSKKSKKQIKNYITKRNQEVTILDITAQKIPEYNNVKNRDGHISNIIIAKIIIPTLFPNLDKALYLDSDLLVTNDLSELYNIDLENNYLFGMAKNMENYTYRDTNKKNTEYFNAGVILMDLKKCRQAKIAEKLTDYFNKNANRFYWTPDKRNDNYTFMFLEQDLINVVVDDRIKKIPQQWNNQCNLRIPDYWGWDSQRLLLEDDIWKQNGGIIHYIGPCKPWMFYGQTNYWKKLYRQYWTKSGLNRYKILYICYSIIQMYEEFFQRIINLNKEIF